MPKRSQQPTLDEIRQWPVTVSLQDACRALGIGLTTGWHLARSNEFPVLVEKIGGRYKVSTARLMNHLGIEEEPPGKPRRRTAR